MTIITDERCTQYSSPGHPERPARISGTLEKLRAQKTLPLKWETAPDATGDQIARAHTREHVAAVKSATEDFDGDTPNHPGIHDHARRSAGGAVRAMQLALKGEPAMSVMRPPGHHATRNRAMGFCYFNSIAIAVLEAQAMGTKRVAVFDFDVHHGNGTEAILLDHPGAVFCSVHQSPCYPGTGLRDAGKNCFNFPAAPKTPRAEYREVLQRALRKALESKPGLLGISAGFDCYARDPLAQETLEIEDFRWLGGQIRAAGVPAFAVLEGGYSSALPELVLAFLEGFANSPRPVEK
jgi:acetoin utilization deacetylase AcuC-like enzyme